MWKLEEQWPNSIAVPCGRSDKPQAFTTMKRNHHSVFVRPLVVYLTSIHNQHDPKIFGLLYCVMHLLKSASQRKLTQTSLQLLVNSLMDVYLTSIYHERDPKIFGQMRRW